MVIVIIVLVVIAGMIATGAFVVHNFFVAELKPIEGNQEIAVTIPKGITGAKAIQILEDEGLIRNAALTRYYVRFHLDGQMNVIAGDYLLRQGMTIQEILDTLAAGTVIKKETVKFTVPEGYNVTQVAQRLAEQGLVNEQIFLEAANNRNYDFVYLESIPVIEDRKYLLEGFLFPETYEILKTATEHDIIQRMLKQFEKEFKDEWLQQLQLDGRTVYEVVIMASIVERETVADKERPIVAGVFYNRLNVQPAWALESCATVQYALGVQRDIITFADLETDSPYNTYRNPGLPPAPIASPGRASLQGTVFPEQHPYFFFVTKKDGSSEHHFSRTLSEHLANDAQSRGTW